MIITRMTRIKNNGLISYQKSRNSKLSLNNFIFMFHVKKYQNNETFKKWPFSICEHYFLHEKEIHVSNCLSRVDEFWLEEFQKEKCNFKKSQKTLETRICLLLQFPDSLLKYNFCFQY